MMDLLMLYSEKHQNDLIHTKEVLLDEYAMHRISAEKSGRDAIETSMGNIFFKNMEKIKLNSLKGKFGKVLVTDDLKKEYESVLKAIFDGIEWIPYPSQAIIDTVLFIKDQVDKKQKEADKVGV
jgi:hypothetical protein